MLTPFFALAAKEIRTLLRSRRAFLFLMLTLGIIGGAFCLLWLSEAGNVDMAGRVRFSRTLFQMLGLTQLCVMGLVTPIMTATAVSGEREQKTLDLLYCTAAPRLGLIFGKWVAAITFQLALLVCLLPVLSLIFQLGGVGLDEYLFTALVIAVAVATYGMLGLAISVRARRSARAMTITLIIILFLNVVVFFVVVVLADFVKLDLPQSFYFTVCSFCSSLFIYFLMMIKGSSINGASLFSSPYLTCYLFSQALLFTLAFFAAWRGLVRGETLKPLTAAPLIDDPKLLARRRRRFPYYLVDPLRRAQVIDEHQDPITVKEQRLGGAARLTTTVRLGYAGLALSVPMIGFVIDAGVSSLTLLSHLMQAGLGFTALFAPLLAATVISREREEGTIDLLLTTPCPPEQIVWAKFIAVLRGLLILIASATALPVVALFLFSGNPLPENLFALLQVLPLALIFLVFYAATGVYCSARSRRNMTAIAASMVLLALFFFSPAIGLGIHDLLGADVVDHSYLLMLTFVVFFGLLCPVLSPIFSLESAFTEAKLNLFQYDKNWIIVLIRIIGVAIASWCLLHFAARRLARRGDGR